MVYALFVKISNLPNDGWRFEDFVTTDEEITKFVETVKAEIELTKDMNVKTLDSEVVCLG